VPHVPAARAENEKRASVSEPSEALEPEVRRGGVETQQPEPTAGAPPRFDRSLSAAIDHAIVQAEAAEHAGDAGSARAWREVLADLQRRIPETRP
jgi:hypothetical protein